MRQFEDEAIQNGYKAIAGIDEAGRGPLAGPVVSAAVVLPHGFTDPDIKDSKQLTPAKRNLLHSRITELALFTAIGVADITEIDRDNILRASLNSMKRACENLFIPPDYLLIDGKFEIKSDIPQKAIIKGDSKSISIAAASIIAKVERDRLMIKFDQLYPEYGFAQHKGYPTKAHKQAIIEHGVTPIHRKTFKGVKEVLVAE
ncbi:MAG: ribonuclease HII [Desulfobacteraceae bacterium]|nr:ribonuclease HII [Desulfobacteraceae bacterium]